MFELILIAGLSPINPVGLQVAQVQPCVWPNLCRSEETVAQVQPCVWPNLCRSDEPAAPVVQVQPCVWPNLCRSTAVELVQALPAGPTIQDKPYQTCDWPNTCS
ncbi:MAG: hypothetical protein HY927_03300 [Elusimicrobia bacterium]|nr:hypothetical protein [Elusimicrobiota bacterium]